MNYGLYYSYKNGDYLRILFNDVLKYDNLNKFDDVEVFYSNNEITEIRIFNFSNIIKIKVDGLIPVINLELLKIINSILKNHNLKTLDDNISSGFEVGKIISINDSNGIKICKVDLGSNQAFFISKANNICDDFKCVVAKNGTFMPNGKRLAESTFLGNEIDGIICTGNDLDSSLESISSDAIELGDGFELGSDFFKLM